MAGDGTTATSTAPLPHDAAVSPDAAPPAVSRRALSGWVLYDLANTLFSINILSNYFPVWFVEEQGGRDGHLALANAGTMALVILTAPVLGALSDQVPRRMPLLVTSTLACCAFTLLLGSGDLPTSLVLFAAANYAFQVGLIFYDALLPAVSTPANRGRIGGLGVGIGYLGSVLGIAVGTIVRATGGSDALIFVVTATLFALIAVPCVLWVREPSRSPRPGSSSIALGPAVRASLGEARRSIDHLRRHRTLSRFLVARLLYADAANTLILYMGIYATAEVGFSDGGKDALLLVGILAAVVGGLGVGWSVDRVGAKTALLGVLGLWAVTIASIAAIGLLDLSRSLFWFAAAAAGASLGGTWAADRPLLLRLAPPDRVGQFVSLYAIAGRFAALLGPLLWALVADGLGWGRPAAVLVLLPMVLMAAALLRSINVAAPIDVG